ncbi:cobyrinate a,c-diamide synthase [Azospirillum halopraeferens]|uniref:cobyrinate a,c-diamide synthase n=1 Tax=Azospirillum halopraeferens TaxID=34010 RepID=UPI00048F8ACB|nr:cobyrinate a,c-diamide synthase [Azospirillum halopraeferens]
MPPPGVIIAAPASGSGKTTLTLGLLAALRARGVAVAAAKVGPDYIDPGFHAAATGRPGVNLDGWAMPPALLDALVVRAGAGADLVVCEGVMGLFDGAAGPGPGGTGSTADIAMRTGWPVVLVVDVRGQSHSAAALVRGFAGHRPGVRIAGVVLNAVGSPRHRAMVEEAMAETGIPVLGALPRDPSLSLPERHLGLVQAEETAGLAGHLERLGRLVAAHVDPGRVVALAAPAAVATAGAAARGPAVRPFGQRIAVARDIAFAFAYPHLLDGWRRAGAELLFFSPLADEPPPADADAAFLPGGYPELHAGRLAAAARWRDGLRAFAATRPVYGECGGYMAMGATLEDADGTVHPMAGLLGVRTSFARRRLHLGYRWARLLADAPPGPAGSVLTGHEFHYATTVDTGGDAPLFACTAADGTDLGPVGGRRGLAAGSFIHLVAGPVG